MPTLLIRHGYATKLVSENRNEKVPIARKNNEQHYAKFGGFVQQTDSLVYSRLSGTIPVKINSVFGFSETDGYLNVQYVGDFAVALGYYAAGTNTVIVPLFVGFPLVWCDLQKTDNANNLTKNSNVINLFSGDNQGRNS